MRETREKLKEFRKKGVIFRKKEGVNYPVPNGWVDWQSNEEFFDLFEKKVSKLNSSNNGGYNVQLKKNELFVYVDSFIYFFDTDATKYQEKRGIEQIYSIKNIIKKIISMQKNYERRYSIIHICSLNRLYSIVLGPQVQFLINSIKYYWEGPSIKVLKIKKDSNSIIEL